MKNGNEPIGTTVVSSFTVLVCNTCGHGINALGWCQLGCPLVGDRGDRAADNTTRQTWRRVDTLVASEPSDGNYVSVPLPPWGAA